MVVFQLPDTRYAEWSVSIAYQAMGAQPIDIIVVPDSGSCAVFIFGTGRAASSKERASETASPAKMHGSLPERQEILAGR